MVSGGPQFIPHDAKRRKPLGKLHVKKKISQSVEGLTRNVHFAVFIRKIYVSPGAKDNRPYGTMPQGQILFEGDELAALIFVCMYILVHSGHF